MSLYHKYDFSGEVRYYRNRLTLIDINIVKYLGADYKPKFDHWFIPPPDSQLEWFVFFVDGEKRYYQTWPKDKLELHEKFLGLGRPGDKKIVYTYGKALKPKSEKSSNSIPNPVNIKSKWVRNVNGELVPPTCCYCAIELNGLTYTRDHIVPRIKGGKDTKGNLRPCCYECNQEKGGLMLHSYIQMLNLLQGEEKPGTERYNKLQTKIINANEIAKSLIK